MKYPLSILISGSYNYMVKIKKGEKMQYKYILFDLDGTLTDPKLGITKSVAYSLQKMKQIEAELNELTKFIGPPLKESYIDFYNFTEEEAEQAIQYYREYFKDKGIYENEIYHGIKELLDDFRLCLVSVMPDYYAKNIFKFKTFRTVGDALQSALRVTGKQATITVAPYGSYTHGTIEKTH